MGPGTIDEQSGGANFNLIRCLRCTRRGHTLGKRQPTCGKHTAKDRREIWETRQSTAYRGDRIRKRAEMSGGDNALKSMSMSASVCMEPGTNGPQWGRGTSPLKRRRGRGATSGGGAYATTTAMMSHKKNTVQDPAAHRGEHRQEGHHSGGNFHQRTLVQSEY